jgi:predicted 3-demethylubiquinone-9 3-methyltransferase (glyoxalase superfamily)
MQKVTPCLWFDKNAEEAMNFYVSVFPNSKIVSIQRYPDGPLEAPIKGMEGKVITGIFELYGQSYMCLDGGPLFKFSEAISFVIECEDQAEVDELWNKLTADGGKESQCGWLKDKFGLSWQITPKKLGQLLSDPDKAKSNRVLQAMLKMQKIIVADLEAAAEGK